MSEQNQASDDADNGQPADDYRGSLGDLYWVVTPGIFALVLLLLAALFWPNLTERTKFFTSNLWNLLIAFAVIAQVVIYRKQWGVMKRQWRVMKQSTDIAEQSLVAGQRAFLSVEFRHSPIRALQVGGQITHWNFTPIWSNAGDTPTRNCTNHTNFKIFDGVIPNAWHFPDLGDEGYVPFSVAPKGMRDGQSISLPVEDIDEMVTGEKAVLFWGWAEYNDVFPNTPKHITRFAVRIIAGGNPREPERCSFYYAFFAVYNCSDEECKYQGYPAGWRGKED